MSKKEFLQLWREVTGNSHFNGRYWKLFRNELRQESWSESHMINWKEMQMKNITATEIRQLCDTGPIVSDLSLANLQPALCTVQPTQQSWIDLYYPKEQEGINPMFKPAYNTVSTGIPSGDLTINLAPAASASVSSKSDVAIQRDYLLSRLNDIDSSFRTYGKRHSDLRATFNLDVNNRPQSSQALIDAIKGGKFKMDDRVLKLQAAGEEYDEAEDRYVGGILDAFIWDGPMPDKKGFDAAREDIKALLLTAKDTIIVKSPDEGLAAIKALEAWTPVGKAN